MPVLFLRNTAQVTFPAALAKNIGLWSRRSPKWWILSAVGYASILTKSYAHVLLLSKWKSCFLHWNRIFCISVHVHCLQACHWIPLRKAWLCLLYSLHQVFIHIDAIPLSLLFCRLRSPSYLSLYLYVRCYKPFTVFVAFGWTCFRASICLVLGSPEPDRALRRVLIMSEQKGRIASCRKSSSSCNPKILIILISPPLIFVLL